MDWNQERCSSIVLQHLNLNPNLWMFPPSIPLGPLLKVLGLLSGSESCWHQSKLIFYNVCISHRATNLTLTPNLHLHTVFFNHSYHTHKWQLTIFSLPGWQLFRKIRHQTLENCEHNFYVCAHKNCRQVHHAGSHMTYGQTQDQTW